VDAFSEDEINEILANLAEQGFSSIDAYIDYLVNKEFKNITYTYSFSSNGEALFLQETLPTNKGTNEFSGQTYTFGFFSTYSLVFTATGFTLSHTSPLGEQLTEGVYAYDSSYFFPEYGGIVTIVWFKPTKIDGKTMSEYYDEVLSFGDDIADAAERTNSVFFVYWLLYDSTNKTFLVNEEYYEVE